MKNVVILKEEYLHNLETALNQYFDKGYMISGGITVTASGYIAVVVKPF